jgi:hypothetical protein
LEIAATGARLALLDGTGQVEGPFGTAELTKKKTFTFSSVGHSKPAVAENVVANPMDSWDSSVVKFHEKEAQSGKMSGNLLTLPWRSPDPCRGNRNPSSSMVKCLAATFPGSAALPFVISTGGVMGSSAHPS